MRWVKVIYWVAFLGVTACSKGGGKAGGQTGAPSADARSVKASRQAQATPFRFYISLSAASQQAVSVQYATTDGTAKAGVDYSAVSGMVNIPAGQTQAYVDVQVS